MISMKIQLTAAVLRRTSSFGLAGIVLCGFLANATSAALVHPGGYQTQDAMALVRSKVASNTEPWASSWAAIKNSGPGPDSKASVKPVITNPYDIQNQGHTVYVLAIKWVASGDIAYAHAAEGMIDAWVDTVTDMSATTTLRTGLGAGQMANAAEILAYGFNGSADWPAANVAKAKAWFKRVVWPKIGTGPMRSANWGTADMSGCMSVAIFCDDAALFNYTINAYKHGFTDTPDGLAGVTEYIDATGENAESGRDQGHSQGGIAHLLEVATMAWHQGVNLVTYTDTQGTVDAKGVSYGSTGANRILLGFEYTAKYNLGHDVPYHPFEADKVIYPNGISAIGRGSFSPMYEMAHYLFSQAGLRHPYTTAVLATAGYRPEKSSSDHVGMGTLLYTPDPNAKVVDGTYGIINRKSQKALDVPAAATVSGTRIDQATYTGGAHQRWTVTSVGNGQYRIIGVGSGKALDVSGNALADGGVVIISPDHNGDNQRWIIKPVGDGYYRVTSVHSGKDLEVKNNALVDHAPVDQWTPNGGMNQQWSFRAP